jgi:hypothetical protein
MTHRSLDKPKIIINCRAFYNYFESNNSNAICGARLNWIQIEFEEFLQGLKEAGAELIFVWKKAFTLLEDEWMKTKNSDYKIGVEFINKVENGNSSDLFGMSLFNCHTFDDSISSVLYYSALKFGEFRGCDLFLKKSGVGHAQIARDIGAYALVGLDTGYLFLEGDFKLWFPQKQNHPQHGDVIKFDVKEYDKKAILNLFGMDISQFQLLAVLGGKFFGTYEDSDKIEEFFKVPRKIDAIKRFVHEQVQLPLTRESIESIIEIIFGHVNPQAVEDFQSSLEAFTPSYFASHDRYPDDEVNKMIADDPFTLAEEILNNQTLQVSSPFLDVAATDMKSLRLLTLPWLKRTMGLLLVHVEGNRSRNVMYRIDEENWEQLEVEPIYPECECFANGLKINFYHLNFCWQSKFRHSSI